MGEGDAARGAAYLFLKCYQNNVSPFDCYGTCFLLQLRKSSDPRVYRRIKSQELCSFFVSLRFTIPKMANTASLKVFDQLLPWIKTLHDVIRMSCVGTRFVTTKYVWMQTKYHATDNKAAWLVCCRISCLRNARTRRDSK